MTDAEKQQLNERVARALGWKRPGNVTWISPMGDEWNQVPDFTDITGPWFGPMVKALVDAGWKVCDPSYCGKYKWLDPIEASDGNPNPVYKDCLHDNVGTATALAFVAAFGEAE